jgi:hypothetical protein
MTWGELKKAGENAADDAEVWVDIPDEEGNMPELDSCDIDDDGDVVLSV